MREHRCLAERIDDFFYDTSPLNLWGIAFIAGFFLCLASSMAGVDDITLTRDGITKQLGFYTALNWSVTFILLYPLYLVCMSQQARNLRATIDDLISQKMIVDTKTLAHVNVDQKGAANGQFEKGAPLLDETAPFQSFRALLKKSNMVYWVLLVGVLIQTGFEWWHFDGQEISAFSRGDVIVDWSTVIMETGARNLQTPVFVFSLAAYLWMGSALFAYLACLLQGGLYAWYFYQLSLPRGEFRVLFRAGVFKRAFSAFFLNYFVAACLGLLAAFFMRLQVGYLFSDKSNILDFWFQDYSWAMKALNSVLSKMTLEQPLGKFQPADVKDPSQYTSIALCGGTLVCLFASLWFIRASFDRSKDYLLDIAKSSNPRWQSLFNLVGMTNEDLSEARSADFFALVVPRQKMMLTILIGILLCTVFTGLGLLFSATMLSALVALVRRAFKQSSSPSKQPSSASSE